MSKQENRHHSERVINNRIKLLKNVDPDWTQLINVPHKLSKRKPFDCCKSRCPLCHSHKYYDKKDKAKYRNKIVDNV